MSSLRIKREPPCRQDCVRRLFLFRPDHRRNASLWKGSDRTHKKSKVTKRKHNGGNDLVFAEESLVTLFSYCKDVEFVGKIKRVNRCCENRLSICPLPLSHPTMLFDTLREKQLWQQISAAAFFADLLFFHISAMAVQWMNPVKACTHCLSGHSSQCAPVPCLNSHIRFISSFNIPCPKLEEHKDNTDLYQAHMFIHHLGKVFLVSWSCSLHHYLHCPIVIPLHLEVRYLAVTFRGFDPRVA